MSRRSRSWWEGERERGEQEEGEGGGPPVETTPKELALRMRKSEDVMSDEYASFYASLSHDCIRKIFLWGSLGRPLLQGKESLAKKCFEMFAGTAEEDGYRKFCEQFEHFEKCWIIQDSTDWTEIAELLRFNISMPGVEQISFEEVRSLSEEGLERHALHHWWEHRRLVVSPVRGYAALEGFCAWWTPWMNMPFNSSINSIRWKEAEVHDGGNLVSVAKIRRWRRWKPSLSHWHVLSKRYLETRLGWEGDHEWLGRGFSVRWKHTHFATVPCVLTWCPRTPWRTAQHCLLWWSWRKMAFADRAEQIVLLTSVVNIALNQRRSRDAVAKWSSLVRTLMMTMTMKVWVMMTTSLRWNRWWGTAEVQQIRRRRRRSTRSHGRMAQKKLVATTVSSREKGMARRNSNRE